MKQYGGLTVVREKTEALHGDKRRGSDLRIPGFSFWLCFLEWVLNTHFASAFSTVN